MVHASRTIKVNNDPAEPPLTRSLVWRGLVMKAENPLPFVPVISSCKVTERRKDGLVREIVDKADTITEVVTFSTGTYCQIRAHVGARARHHPQRDRRGTPMAIWRFVLLSRYRSRASPTAVLRKKTSPAAWRKVI
jgi:hypothetical protein